MTNSAAVITDNTSLETFARQGKWLLLFALLQGCILVGIWIRAAIPLWIGQEIRLETRPFDPRSLFRGNYARLNYDISRIPVTEFEQPKRLREGEVIYVSLKPDANNLWRYQSVSLQPPESGVFLRGRLEHKILWTEVKEFRVKYGIEALFAPKEKAIALEKQLRQQTIVIIKVDDNGRARIDRIEKNNN